MPSFTIKQGKEFGQFLRAGATKAVRRGIYSAAFRTIERIQTSIIPSETPPPVFDGVYRAGWHVDPIDDQGKGPISIVNNVPYANIIDKGARGENIVISRAMIEALTEWVLRKGLVGRPARGARRAVQEAEARQTAWAIAVSMRSKGIFNRDGNKGLNISKKAKDYLKTILKQEIAAEIKREFGGRK